MFKAIVELLTHSAAWLTPTGLFFVLIWLILAPSACHSRQEERTEQHNARWVTNTALDGCRAQWEFTSYCYWKGVRTSGYIPWSGEQRGWKEKKKKKNHRALPQKLKEQGDYPEGWLHPSASNCSASADLAGLFCVCTNGPESDALSHASRRLRNLFFFFPQKSYCQTLVNGIHLASQSLAAGQASPKSRRQAVYYQEPRGTNTSPYQEGSFATGCLWIMDLGDFRTLPPRPLPFLARLCLHHKGGGKAGREHH